MPKESFEQLLAEAGTTFDEESVKAVAPEGYYDSGPENFELTDEDIASIAELAKPQPKGRLVDVQAEMEVQLEKINSLPAESARRKVEVGRYADMMLTAESLERRDHKAWREQQKAELGLDWRERIKREEQAQGDYEAKRDANLHFAAPGAVDSTVPPPVMSGNSRALRDQMAALEEVLDRDTRQMTPEEREKHNFGLEDAKNRWTAAVLTAGATIQAPTPEVTDAE